MQNIAMFLNIDLVSLCKTHTHKKKLDILYLSRIVFPLQLAENVYKSADSTPACKGLYSFDPGAIFNVWTPSEI